EGEGTATVAEWHDSGREKLERRLVRAGEHVDHARFAVGANLEEELAEAVDDLVAPVDELQLAGELGRPLGQVVDVGEVSEHLVLGCRERGGDSVMSHA